MKNEYLNEILRKQLELLAEICKESVLTIKDKIEIINKMMLLCRYIDE